MAGISKATQRSFNAAASRIRSAARQMGAAWNPRLIGEEIMTDVKDSRPGHGVPVDTGALRNSGKVTGGVGQVTAVQRVTLSFGGAAAPYALIQHENVQYAHPVGEARYLVRGLERWKPGGSRAWATMQRNANAALKSAASGRP